MKCGLHAVEQIATVHLIGSKLPLSRLEIFCSEQAQILLIRGFAKEIFPHSGATGDGGTVGKIKIVLVIHMYIQNVGSDIFYFFPLEEGSKMPVRNSVQYRHGAIQAQTCVTIVLGAFLAASIRAVIFEEVIAAFGSFAQNCL